MLPRRIEVVVSGGLVGFRVGDRTLMTWQPLPDELAGSVGSLVTLGLRPESVPEDHWLDPRNVYAATKLAQEHLCAAYAREHDGRVLLGECRSARGGPDRPFAPEEIISKSEDILGAVYPRAVAPLVAATRLEDTTLARSWRAIVADFA